ncbi:hypothetical protein AFAE65S_01742 [Alcaligenes phenolicus]
MPATKVFIRYVVIGLGLALQPFVAHSAASQTWPQPPSQLSLDSPYGTLQVSQSDYVYEAQLQLDSQIIAPELKGLINIPYGWSEVVVYFWLTSAPADFKSGKSIKNAQITRLFLCF